MKIAFAGAGYIINIHAKAAKAQKDVELAAVVEKYSDKAAALALAGNLYYVFVYTKLLKRRTPQNIVIGGAAGSYTQDSPQTVVVDFWLLQGVPPGGLELQFLQHRLRPHDHLRLLRVHLGGAAHVQRHHDGQPGLHR